MAHVPYTPKGCAVGSLVYSQNFNMVQSKAIYAFKIGQLEVKGGWSLCPRLVVVIRFILLRPSTSFIKLQHTASSETLNLVSDQSAAVYMMLLAL